ncbi:unnamed protein product [Darwinula stevensoni]|uniref:Uncharacterized protein n=1 Tax=Darwinula stevensoni TaxID=69355 RepID=A0A7R9A117_9CRUS|nr:unnamed protein product [Darwinula stevensoni]CAG0882477.1 unnamed protein product [Darwinula stevensoni]
MLAGVLSARDLRASLRAVVGGVDSELSLSSSSLRFWKSLPSNLANRKDQQPRAENRECATASRAQGTLFRLKRFTGFSPSVFFHQPLHLQPDQSMEEDTWPGGLIKEDITTLQESTSDQAMEEDTRPGGLTKEDITTLQEKGSGDGERCIQRLEASTILRSSDGERRRPPPGGFIIQVITSILYVLQLSDGELCHAMLRFSSFMQLTSPLPSILRRPLFYDSSPVSFETSEVPLSFFSTFLMAVSSLLDII